MSFDRNEKQNATSYKLRPISLMAAVMALVITVSGNAMPLAAAITDVVQDYGLGCGNRLWGIKDYQNRETGQWFFGKDSGCSTVLNTYYGRDNVAKIHTAMNTGGQSDIITWEAVIQGKDPWNTVGTPAPVFSNANFPASSTNNYNLRAQWTWTTDKAPISANIKANYLTDLWFKNGNNYLVIDFMWMQLKNNGSGTWMQVNPVPDYDGNSLNGVQYSNFFCSRELSADHVTYANVYHYNVLLENGVSHAKNLWAEKSANINSYISDAFNNSYSTSGGCTASSPGLRSGYSITGVESGIELLGSAGEQGRVEGGYSMTELSY
jgi:hypothetical protein